MFISRKFGGAKSVELGGLNSLLGGLSPRVTPRPRTWLPPTSSSVKSTEEFTAIPAMILYMTRRTEDCSDQLTFS